MIKCATSPNTSHPSPSEERLAKGRSRWTCLADDDTFGLDCNACIKRSPDVQAMTEACASGDLVGVQSVFRSASLTKLLTNLAARTYSEPVRFVKSSGATTPTLHNSCCPICFPRMAAILEWQPSTMPIQSYSSSWITAGSSIHRWVACSLLRSRIHRMHECSYSDRWALAEFMEGLKFYLVPSYA